jgi:hypothetical protein
MCLKNESPSQFRRKNRSWAYLLQIDTWHWIWCEDIDIFTSLELFITWELGRRLKATGELLEEIRVCTWLKRLRFTFPFTSWFILDLSKFFCTIKTSTVYLPFHKAKMSIFFTSYSNFLYILQIGLVDSLHVWKTCSVLVLEYHAGSVLLMVGLDYFLEKLACDHKSLDDAILLPVMLSLWIADRKSTRTKHSLLWTYDFFHYFVMHKMCTYRQFMACIICQFYIVMPNLCTLEKQGWAV